MVVWLYYYFTGYLKVELSGASQERFINMCMHHKIRIWNLRAHPDKYIFSISQRDFKKLKPMIRKTNVTIMILEKKGFPFLIFRYRKRHLFWAGIFIFLSTTILLSQFIWTIDISGNQYYTDEMIVSYLNDNDIQITMLTRDVDCDNIVSILRKEFEYITWVSAHINGCRLIISVKENDQIDTSDFIDMAVSATLSTEKEETEGHDIIAQESGTITSIITRAGTPQVHVGDVVEAGDILVSGCLELYDDYGEITGYYYVEADADIYINTAYRYSNTVELAYMDKVYSDMITVKDFIRIGNYYVIALKLNEFVSPYDITIQETSLVSDQQNSWYLSVGTMTYYEYQWTDAIYTDEEIQEILTTEFRLYCEELNEKNVEIFENNVTIYIGDKSATASGTLDVIVKNDKVALTSIRDLPLEEAQEGTSE